MKGLGFVDMEKKIFKDFSMKKIIRPGVGPFLARGSYFEQKLRRGPLGDNTYQT